MIGIGVGAGAYILTRLAVRELWYCRVASMLSRECHVFRAVNHQIIELDEGEIYAT